MPNYHQLSFTKLELTGLWVRATGGSTSNDTALDLAAESAIDKLYRADRGLPAPRPPQRQARGKSIGTLWRKRAAE